MTILTGNRSTLSFVFLLQAWGGLDHFKRENPDFGGVATRLVADMARMLKVNGTLSTSRAPEPSPEISWQYTKGKLSRDILL
jgi:hypothetical protein